MRKKGGRRIITVFLVVIVCAFALFPFLWMISTSLKPAEEVYTNTPAFIPENPTVKGYAEMLTTESSTFDFKQWAANSVIIALLTTVFSMIIATLGGLWNLKIPVQGTGGAILHCAHDSGAAGIPAYDSFIYYHGKSKASGYQNGAGDRVRYVFRTILYMDDEGIL